MPRPPRFTIRAASALTGINQNTLRAWERRHGLVRPERTPKGYRLYSNDDLERLRLIQRVLAEGVSIGRVREYLEAPGAVERLLESRTAPPTASSRHTRVVEVSLAGAGLNGTTTIRVPAAGRPGDPEPVLASFAVQIEQSALGCDRAGLERGFARAVGLCSLRQAFHQSLAPALTRLSQRGVDDPAGSAAEHFLMAFARERLLSALAGLRPLHQQPRVIFACVPGGPHEIVHMLLSLEVGLEGVSTRYLGAGTPVEAIAQAAQAAGARAVALSATLATPPETLLDLRDRLATSSRPPRVLVAGPAACHNREWLEAHGFRVLSLDPIEAAAEVLRAIGQD
jgi:DNA-binding transcriptional MerR regulator/methylmalonyl-CoA mutase cobalamin-binding subunit